MNLWPKLSRNRAIGPRGRVTKTWRPESWAPARVPMATAAWQSWCQAGPNPAAAQSNLSPRWVASPPHPLAWTCSGSGGGQRRGGEAWHGCPSPRAARARRDSAFFGPSLHGFYGGSLTTRRRPRRVGLAAAVVSIAGSHQPVAETVGIGCQGDPPAPR